MSSEDKLVLETEYNDQTPKVAFKWSSTKRKLWISIAVLAVILAAAVITVIGVAAALGVARSSDSDDDSMCLTEGCVQLASRMRSSMDQSVDPCQDFYTFSCGRYEDNTVTPLGM